MEFQKITSRQNEKIKRLNKLKQKKYRDEFKLFVVENFKIIKHAYEAGYYFEELFIEESFLEKNLAEVKELCEKNKNTKIYIINEPVNKALTSLKTPSGIACVFSQKTVHLDYNFSIVYLNGINNPGNLGAIFRSALAFGIKSIVLDKVCVDQYNSKTIQSAKDAIFKLNIIKSNKPDILNKIKKNMPILVADMSGKELLASYKFPAKFCLVLGNEAHGVDTDILKISDNILHIEMSQEMESLNVVVASSLVLYQAFLQKLAK